MEAVIEAPPELIWKLWIETNNWGTYRIPFLRDSRTVTEEIATAVGSTQQADKFYQILDGRVFDSNADRREGKVWSSYFFQYYNVKWPFTDRWTICKVSNDERESDKGIYKAQWSHVAGNVRTLEGTLLLEPFEGNRKRTYMDYRLESDPGGFIPKFLVKVAVEKSMPAAIKAIRREALKRK